MNGYWVIGIFVAGLTIGMYIEHEFNLAGKFLTLDRQVIATEKAQESTSALVGASDVKTDQLSYTANSEGVKLNVAETKNPDPCNVPADRLQSLRAVAAAARRAAGGANH